MDIIIINGVNTDVGKTFISHNILTENMQKNNKINYIKPIISGFVEKDLPQSDIGKALSAMNVAVNMINAKKRVKYFLTKPTSPDIAAQIENIQIEYNEMLKFCINSINQALKEKSDIIIEMAGGICTPISHDKTMLDLTVDINSKFKARNVLVASNYLGGISHTISACKLFNFQEVILNIQHKTEFDCYIKKTLERFLKKTVMVPLGGLEPPRA